MAWEYVLFGGLLLFGFIFFGALLVSLLVFIIKGMSEEGRGRQTPYQNLPSDPDRPRGSIWEKINLPSDRPPDAD